MVIKDLKILKQFENFHDVQFSIFTTIICNLQKLFAKPASCVSHKNNLPVNAAKEVSKKNLYYSEDNSNSIFLLYFPANNAMLDPQGLY